MPTDVDLMTPQAASGKSKFLDSGGSMFAKLKRKGVDESWGRQKKHRWSRKVSLAQESVQH